MKRKMLETSYINKMFNAFLRETVRSNFEYEPLSNQRGNVSELEQGFD